MTSSLAIRNSNSNASRETLNTLGVELETHNNTYIDTHPFYINIAVEHQKISGTRLSSAERDCSVFPAFDSSVENPSKSSKP